MNFELKKNKCTQLGFIYISNKINSRKMDLTQRIKSIRQAKQISQVDVANKLGMDRANYHRLESKGNKLSYEQIEAIAGALGISVQDLLFGSEKQKEEDFEKFIIEIKLYK